MEKNVHRIPTLVGGPLTNMNKLLALAKSIGNRQLRYGKTKSWVNDNYTKEVAELFVAWYNEEITTQQLCKTIDLPTTTGAYFNRSVSVIREGIKRGDISLRFVQTL